MLPGLSAAAWAWLGIVVAGAAFVRGYSGFGSAALMVLGASLVVDPETVIPAVVLVELMLAVPQWPGMRGDVDWRRAGALFGGCLLGVPLGVRAVAAMGPDATRAAIAALVLAACALLWRGARLRRPAGMASHAGVGVASGLANAAAVGGLPVAAFFAAQPLAPAAFRATLIAYFTALDLWTLPVMARAGLLGPGDLALAALALPVAVAAALAGGRRFLRTPPEDFRRFAILLLAGLAVLGLGRSLL